jgi:hypothetical protein
MILARFGSLTNIGNPIRSCYAVAKMLGCNHHQVWRAQQKYVDGIVDLRYAQFRQKPNFWLKRRFPRAFPNADEIEKELTSEALLKEWAPYSVAERAHKVTEKFNVPCSM